MPVLRPNEFMFLVGSYVDRYAQDDEHDDSRDLQRRQPVLYTQVTSRSIAI